MPDRIWTRLHAALLLLGALGLCFGLPMIVILLVALLSFTSYLATNYARWGDLYPLGGYANIVTCVRLSLLLFTSWLYTDWHPYLLFLAFLIIIVSDGVDGYLARKYDQQTKLGATLDIETDALTCALLASIHYLQDTAGGWILLTGYMRYAYVWIVAFFGLEEAKERPHPYARITGILFICSLMGPMVAPMWLAFPVLVLGSLLVSFSFALSFFRKWQAGTRAHIRR